MFYVMYMLSQKKWYACCVPRRFSHVWLFAAPRTVAHQAPLSKGFSRQEYWSGLPFPSPGIFPTQRTNLGLLHCRQILYHLSHQGSPICEAEILDIPIPGGSCKNWYQVFIWNLIHNTFHYILITISILDIKGFFSCTKYISIHRLECITFKFSSTWFYTAHPMEKALIRQSLGMISSIAILVVITS